ncbi:hypothetical protein BDR26DRAFT_853856 [Obelidium mucronatum]|nr:hypothetical protein BDR26DRAFT_853856 [Obelidium mucronatum]
MNSTKDWKNAWASTVDDDAFLDPTNDARIYGAVLSKLNQSNAKQFLMIQWANNSFSHLLDGYNSRADVEHSSSQQSLDSNVLLSLKRVGMDELADWIHAATKLENQPPLQDSEHQRITLCSGYHFFSIAWSLIPFSAHSESTADDTIVFNWALVGKITPFQFQSQEIADRICAVDWSNKSRHGVMVQSPLLWDPAILTSISRTLTSPTPTITYMGRDFVVVAANDSAVAIAGSKLKNGIGEKLQDVYPEAWETVRDKNHGVYDTQVPHVNVNRPHVVNVHEFDQELYLSVVTTPIILKDGNSGGIIAELEDRSGFILQTRRFEFVRDLGSELADCNSVSEFWARLSDLLPRARDDIPDFIIYECDSTSAVAITGGKTHSTMPSKVLLKHHSDPTSVAASTTPITSDIEEYYSIQIRKCYHTNRVIQIIQPAQTASSMHNQKDKTGCINILPIQNGMGTVVGLIAVFTNSLLPFDEAYRDFFGIVQREISREFKIVSLFENERKHRVALTELDQAKSAFFALVGQQLKTPLSLILGPLETALSEPHLPASMRPGLEIAFQPLHLATAFANIVDGANLEYRISIDPCLLGADKCYVDIAVWENIVLGLLGHAVKHTLKGFISCELVRSEGGDAVELVIVDSGTHLAVADDNDVPPELRHIQELVKIHLGSMNIQILNEGGMKVAVTVPLGVAHIPADRVLDIRHDSEPENFMWTTTTKSAASQSNSGTRSNSTASTMESCSRSPSLLTGRSSHGFDLESSATAAPLLEVPTRMKRTERQVLEDDGNPRENAIVFLVDPNADSLSHFTQVLSRKWKTRAFSDGQQVLDAIEASVFPSVILANIMLPGMNGASGTKDIPVILMSDNSEFRISAAQTGADDFMVRPFSNKELMARVQTQIDMFDLRRKLLRQIKEKTSLTELQMNLLNDIVEQSESGIYYATITAGWYGYDERETLIQDHRNKVFSMYDRILPEYRSELRERFAKAISEKQKFSAPIVFRFETPSGLLWLESSCILQYDSDGTFIGVIAAFTDVTPRVDFEEEKIARIRADEAELSRKQQEDFIDMICHEIRNPLSGISNTIEFMKETLQEIRNHVCGSKENASLSKLVDTTLEYAETISFCARHQKVIKKNPFFISSNMGRKHIEPTVSISEKLQACQRSFKGDPNRLSQVIINLISNAIKFTSGRETRKINVSADVMDVPAVFEVTDTGAGMSKEETERLFQRFSQMSKTNEYGGSGLGLYISKNLVELMGGKMEVRSMKDVGTTFAFTVQQNYSDKATKRKAPETEADDKPLAKFNRRLGPKNDKFKFLVVDDNQINRTVLERHLRQFYVRTATNGQEALTAFESDAFDLILMDIEMPLMNGIDATIHIRQL